MENTPTFVEHVASAPHMVMQSPYLPKSHRKQIPPRQPFGGFPKSPVSRGVDVISQDCVSVCGLFPLLVNETLQRCARMSRISIPSRCNKAQVTFEVVEVRESMSFKISV